MNPEQLPCISILIAARNEEKTILDCLGAIEQLDYPQAKLEILIGNDQSTDNTLLVIENYIQEKPQFQAFDITEQVPGQQGKANVLAQLTRKAQGEIYFFTDADVVLPKNCLQTVYYFIENDQLGVLSGFTLVRPKGFWAILQSLEWLEALSWIKLASDMKIPVTALGNHLWVTRNAYEAVGGYENIPFSVTEDFALFHQIVQKGFDFYHLLDAQTLAYTSAASNLQELFQQRKRWMRGARQLAWWMQLPLFLSALMLPLSLMGMALSIKLTICILLGIFILQNIWLGVNILKINKLFLIHYLFFYNVYKLFIGFGLLIYYFLPVKVRWKGRFYNT